MILFRDREYVDRVLNYLGRTAPPAQATGDEPLADPMPEGTLVGFHGGPLNGHVSVMPATADYWVEPDGTLYS